LGAKWGFTGGFAPNEGVRRKINSFGGVEDEAKNEFFGTKWRKIKIQVYCIK
jgi:hypothetical protein